MSAGTIPRGKVEELARLVKAQRVLQAQRAATQAQMIRACLDALLMDPGTHRMRGHEELADRRRIKQENVERRAMAVLHLQALATMLEDAAARELDLSPEPPNVITLQRVEESKQGQVT